MDAIVASIQMKLQYAVSGDKIRYKDGKYDLDLTYITPNIIAMAIPGEGVVSAWRNSTADVARYLNTAHGSRYKIFNISQERYRYDLFDGEIDDQFGWPDHHSPPLRLLYDMVMAMDAWQKKDPRQNIIIVHCKAGRSRTGCAIAAYLLHAGICADAESAIKLFNTKRSFYENGVVLPSQIRCVAAFEQLLKVGVKTLDNPRKVFIREIVVAPPILIEGSKKSSTGGSCLPVTVIEHLGNTEPHQTIKRINHPQTWREDGKMRLIVNAYVEGDVQIRILHYANDMSRFTKGMKRIHGVLTGFQTASLYPHIPLFRYTFHTNFINEEEVVLDVSMLDAALAGPLKPNDRVPANLQARFFFEEVDGPLGSNPPLASSASMYIYYYQRFPSSRALRPNSFFFSF
jgi:phosphatidylinositol-3,4,5-trisphosphate 3-phosphatase/dual-specificity protein phosphatase PTEN